MKQFDQFSLDIANQCLMRDGQSGSETLDLPPKPFAVLRYLVEHPGRLITHDELLDALWPETYVQPQVLRTYMQDLRKVLGDDAAHPRFIQTLPKRGYRFIAPVAESASEESEAGRHEIAPELAPSSGSQILSPVQSAALAAAPLIGRDGQLALLHTRTALLAAGQRQVVFITGESGIGKTALVDAFCRSLDPSASIKVARGQCVQGASGMEDLFPVLEALGQLSCHPQLSLSGLCAAIEELAAAHPLLLIFEDLHWADDATLRLISALARRRGAAKLMLLATCCPLRCDPASAVLDATGAQEDALKRLQQDLELRRLSLEIALPPLSKASVAELLRRELGQQTLPPGLTDFVCQRSEGNPLFVIAVLEHLLAQGMLVQAENAVWQQSQPWPELDAVVPHQLARMIELEIERLNNEEQHLLEAASLMPVAFPAWAVAAALELDPVEVEESCDRLARRVHFVVRAGQDELPGGTRSTFYVFAHGMYRQVLYQRQSEARRARRHIRIAERLAELFAGREASVARELSMHYQAAGVPERVAESMLAGAH